MRLQAEISECRVQLEPREVSRHCVPMDVHPLIRHEPDPKHPGWWTWEISAEDRFNSVIGKLLVRPDEPGRATCRMFPEARHANLGNMVHGGAILTFVDMALFAGGLFFVAGLLVLSAVLTLLLARAGRKPTATVANPAIR